MHTKIRQNLRTGALKLICILAPLLCIYAGETTKLSFLFGLKEVGHEESSLLNSLIMSLSLVGVPVIGLFSDKNCRKKTLMCLVFFEIAALFLLEHSPFVAAVLQGLIGAAVVAVSRAAYLDVRPVVTNIISRNSVRIPEQDDSLLAGIAVVETVIIQAAAWTFHPFLPDLDLVFLSKLLFALLIIILIFFNDLRDWDLDTSHHEIKSAQKKYLRGYAWQLLVAFFLYDCAFQTPNYFSEAYYNTKKLSEEIDIVGSGVLLGCIVVWVVLLSIYHVRSIRHLITKKERMMYRIRKNLFFSSLALFSVFLFPFAKWKSLFHSKIEFIDLFLFTFIGGIILALIFVYFTNRVKAHERGFLYGILEEVETLAEAISPVFVYSFLPAGTLTNIPFIILIGAGLLCIRKFKNKGNMVDQLLIK